VKGRLGCRRGPRRGDDLVHQLLAVFTQHTSRSHHYVNLTMT
jgi:hypothetical protein